MMILAWIVLSFTVSHAVDCSTTTKNCHGEPCTGCVTALKCPCVQCTADSTLQYGCCQVCTWEYVNGVLECYGIQPQERVCPDTPTTTSAKIGCDTCEFGYFDGCNACSCLKDGSVVCTDLACDKTKMPYCTVPDTTTSAPDTTTVAPTTGCDTCESGLYNDGCNDCYCELNMYGVTTAMCESNSCMMYGDPYCIDCDGCDPYGYSDGCNTCTCYKDGSVGCTDQACDTREIKYPYCTVPDTTTSAPDTTTVAPTPGCGTCESGLYNDGCHNCYCDAKTGKETCDTNNCLVWSDPYCIDCDECDEYFDGCNTCTCGADKAVTCTKIDCSNLDDLKFPYCTTVVTTTTAPDTTEAKTTASKTTESKTTSADTTSSGGCSKDCKSGLYFDGCNYCRCEDSKETCGGNVCKRFIESYCIGCDTCDSYFDGCSTCQCDAEGVAGCTDIACFVYELPYCIDVSTTAAETTAAETTAADTTADTEATTTAAATTSASVIDCSTCPSGVFTNGCQDCYCDNKGVAHCDDKLCFWEGVAKCYDCDTCPDGFFDGCNTCTCDADTGSTACTEKWCEPWGFPDCLDSDVGCDTCRETGLYFDGCNACFCNEGVATCDDNECKEEEESYCINCDECEYGYNDGCNDCFCDEDTGEVSCTKKLCVWEGFPSCLDGPTTTGTTGAPFDPSGNASQCSVMMAIAFVLGFLSFIH
eukprot:408615_1